MEKENNLKQKFGLRTNVMNSNAQDTLFRTKMLKTLFRTQHRISRLLCKLCNQIENADFSGWQRFSRSRQHVN